MTADEVKAKLDKLDTLSKVDKNSLFAECVKERLKIHTILYAQRLEKSLESLYNNVNKRDIAHYTLKVNKELMKTKGTKYCYFKEEDS